MPTAPNFDRVARPYRWLEYLTLGRTLECCRNYFLPQLQHCRHALVLGDGDGRFLAKLLMQNVNLEADVIDISAAMLELLRLRCNQCPSPSLPITASRLNLHQADARSFLPPTTNYDLVITHFFLDCLTQPELETLIQNIAPKLTPGATWLISDFQIPSGLMRLPAKLYIRTLYLAFRLLTNLQVTRLPDYVAPLTKAGFIRTVEHNSLFGILTTQLWKK